MFRLQGNDVTSLLFAYGLAIFFWKPGDVVKHRLKKVGRGIGVKVKVNAGKAAGVTGGTVLSGHGLQRLITPVTR